MTKPDPNSRDADPQETKDWLESLDAVLRNQGAARARFLVEKLVKHSRRSGIPLDLPLNTPYLNSIPLSEQAAYPGDPAIEWRLRSLIRWNAMAMVVRANMKYPGIGGHISTFASCATLFEVAFNHYLRGKDAGGSGDQVYFQGHAAPGIYARAFLEGRVSQAQLENFRRELERGGGLSSYPHPWLMPGFWEFPTVSMGLSPLMAIYQARFNRYLQARGLHDTSASRVWCFMGDGETDEPESLGSISIAARERLDNLIFVINCNLQRLDGPVRGNGKIIQELEAVFRGAGWNVLKVIWGSSWDPILAQDHDGLLAQRMNEVVDGQYQKFSVCPGDVTRKEFFGVHPDLLKMAEHLSDEQIRHLRRGGHDPEKVNAAYHAAVAHRGQPTVILAKTIKGYGLGEAGEGRNITHQQKKLNEAELKAFRDRFQIPISDHQINEVPFYRPDPKSPEMEYLLERRRHLGGFLPQRRVRPKSLTVPPLAEFQDVLDGTREGKKIATTMAFGRILNHLLRDKTIGRRIVPIIPDEARTFGLDPLFKQVGIYSSLGQLYEPVDREHLYYYRESEDGQILEEGITEAGSMGSFAAAGTSYATHGEPTVPFYIFYSMYGFQRVGDLIWAFGDLRGRGFLIGATAGRTTLAGEGLQHQDGHSHLLASTVPNLRAYHPGFGYEIAVIVCDGLKRMIQDQEDVFYYLTVENETYEMPAMPPGVESGILEGLYPFRRTKHRGRPHVHLFGSSAILRHALLAADLLEEKYGCSADVWSATSYYLLRKEALAAERWNMLHPESPPRIPRVQQILKKEKGPFLAAGDWLKAVPDQIARWVPGGLFSLGTDGYGRSDGREALRRFFEVDAETITVAALNQLAIRGEIEKSLVAKAIGELGIDPEKADPVLS